MYDPNSDRSLRLRDRLAQLLSLPAETEWLEFKTSNADPQMIGKTISALANAAALHDQSLAWLIWGVADETHELIGTSFNPNTTRVGNQPLELWLAQRMLPDCPCHFQRFEIDAGFVVMLEIPAAVRAPTEFDGTAYIRIGSTTPTLSDFAERQRQLWQKLIRVSFEQDTAATAVSASDVLSLLNVQACFDLLGYPLPDSRDAMLQRLEVERLIRRDLGDRYDILNLGALLYGKDLNRFGHLGRKQSGRSCIKDAA